ncbi:uncharacterized protein LOC107265775 [Cephus cinctus]|uniref:Uncharacterized protein LOC107265775 n=1 Tax=Cephus cinctus TaxID=211228 RepID=A0AAJ7FGS0_CEPCN|nr:uncharacterized protein LOC107265775 [Cephus cinctus]
MELEEQCENAVFEVCDARERYPSKCAQELAKCIELETEINTGTINLKSTKPLNVLKLSKAQDDRHRAVNVEWKTYSCQQIQDEKLQKLLEKMNNLKAVLEQIEKDKFSEINRLIK